MSGGSPTCETDAVAAPFLLVLATARAREDARDLGITCIEEAVGEAIVSGRKSARPASGLPKLRPRQRYAHLDDRHAAIVEHRPGRLGKRRATWIVGVFEKREG
jgi:hypothetical protein